MRFYLFFTLACLFAACKNDSSSSTASVQEEQAPADALFKQLKAEQSGVDFANAIQESFEHNIVTNPYLYNGGGVAIIDYDHDGLEDLFFSATSLPCKLYKNLGGLKFQDVTKQAGIVAEAGIKTGVTIVDLNADGWEDVYICRTGLVADFNRANMAWINQQNGTFKEMAAAMGLNSNTPSNHAAFLDYDQDGDLDMYLLNHPTDFNLIAKIRVEKAADGTLKRASIAKLDAESDRFFRNDAGKFTDVSEQAGIGDVAFGLSVTVTDLNRDGWPDLYVANDYIEPDIIYINQRGRFVIETDKYFRHMSSQSMGAEMADLNQDGINDLVVMDMLPHTHTRTLENEMGMAYERQNTLIGYGYKRQLTRNMLQMGTTRGQMTELGCYAGVHQTDWSWCPVAADFDLDGHRDMFFSNGMRRDVTNLDYTKFTTDSIEKRGGLSRSTYPDINDYLNLIPSIKQRNFTYRNLGDMRFEDVSVAWGITPHTFTHGVASADLDKDGDLDLVMNNLNDRAYIYQNTAADTKKGHWVNVRLEGAEAGNKFAVGAKIQALIGDRIFYTELSPTRGFFSSATLLTHIGLGAATKIDVLEVEFPGKKVVQMRNVTADQFLTVSAAQAKPGSLSMLKPAPAPLFASAAAPAWKHIQPANQDFLKQRLLPWTISDAGPCMAVGAMNKDAQPDVFVGGGVGQAGAIWLGGTTPKPSPALEADKALADAAAVLFDADADGDQDLAVGSGGAEWPANHANYQARLYINDGNGGYTKASATLPCAVPVGAITATDLDADGDQDLLLAESHRLDNYPLKMGVRCLLNDGKGTFTDASATAGATMQRLGRVTDMAVAQVTGDAQPELILVGEWMPITVLQRNGTAWTNISTSLGLDGTDGLWNTIEASDLNADGTTDLVGGNLGWNTRYRASASAPMVMYGSDFDRNGAQDPVMCLTIGGKEHPYAYRDVMVAQVPAIKKKAIKYTQYAHSTVQDLFTPAGIGQAERSTAQMLESSVFYMKNGRFERTPLPNMAQSACIHSIAVVDVNKDGKPDLLCVGNDRGHQSEVGPLDSGTGMVLLQQADGSFKYVSSDHSGFWADQEARAVQVVGGNRVWVTNQGGPLQAFGFK